MTTKVNLALSVTILALILATPAISATYKWIDEDGNVVYSQRPPPNGQYEAIRIKPVPRSKSATRPAEKKPIDQNEWLKKSSDKRKDDSKVEAELAKTKKLREENCTKAKKQLEIYTVYSRVKDDKGGFRRITDDERDAGIKEAKQSIKDFCD